MLAFFVVAKCSLADWLAIASAILNAVCHFKAVTNVLKEVPMYMWEDKESAILVKELRKRGSAFLSQT